MELSQLKIVMVLAKLHSFSQAAEQMYVSQSSLSQQIIKLEAELGLKLFLRTTRSVELTEAGRDFVEQTGAILSQLDVLRQSMDSFVGLKRGTLRIGTISSLKRIDFSGMLTSFYSLYPALQIDIVHDGSFALAELLRKNEIDVAFLATYPGIAFKNVTLELLGTDEYRLAVSCRHRLAKRGIVDLAELKDERFIFHHPNQTMYQVCLDACARAGFVPNIVCHNSRTAIGFSLIAAGLGVGFFPLEDFAVIQPQQVTALQLKVPLRKYISLALRQGEMPSPLVDTFCRFVRDHCQILTKSLLQCSDQA